MKSLKLPLKIKKYSGFSTIEMLLYMGIFAIFITAMTQILVLTLDTERESFATSSVAQDTRYIMARLIYDITRAQSIQTPVNIGDTTPNLVLTINGVSYSYSVVASNLQLVNDLGTNILNSFDTSLSGVSFQKIGNPLGKSAVQIRFTVTSNTKRVNVVETKTVQTTVGTR